MTKKEQFKTSENPETVPLSEQETTVQRSNDTKPDIISKQERIEILFASGIDGKKTIFGEFNDLNKRVLRHYRAENQPIDQSQKTRDIEDLRVFLKAVQKCNAPLATQFNNHYNAQKAKLKALQAQKPTDPSV